MVCEGWCGPAIIQFIHSVFLFSLAPKMGTLSVLPRNPLSGLSYSELGFAASPKQILAAMLFLHVLAAASIMQKINYSGFLAHNDAGD